jgi:uncharacterized surface protein with fasciclin (FAS1) repeats
MTLTAPTQSFRKTIALALAATGALVVNTPALADHHADASMHTEANLVETAMGTGMHETLVTAVKAADLVATLSSPGPFTLFAPTDAAFDKLPDGIVATLVKPENQSQLTTILTYHAVAGSVSASDLTAAINDNGGTYMITTVAGAELEASLSDGAVIITDATGRRAAVTQADVMTSNGVIHVTDGVFLPG